MTGNYLPSEKAWPWSRGREESVSTFIFTLSDMFSPAKVRVPSCVCAIAIFLEKQDISWRIVTWQYIFLNIFDDC